MKLAIDGDFELAQRKLSAALKARKPSLDWYTDRWYPFCLILSKSEIRKLREIQELIYQAFSAIVPRYLHDPHLKERIPMSPWVREIFARLDGTPYHPGALRPDVLIGQDGSFQVCEINARFPLNGFFISLYAQEILDAVRPQYRPPGSLARLRSELLGEPITIVKSEERGYDLFLLRNELKEQGHLCRLMSPDEFLKDSSSQKVMLELHLHELQQVPLEFLLDFHRNRRYFNDLRTVILGHDKRLLSVLSDRELLSEYLPAKQAHRLADQVVPTFTVTRPPTIQSPSWILKPAHRGKGEGVVVSSRQTLLLDSVTQPEVKQKIFSLHDGSQVRMVGLLPMWNGSFYGPGIFRAGPGPIVNLSDGGLLVASGGSP